MSCSKCIKGDLQLFLNTNTLTKFFELARCKLIKPQQLSQKLSVYKLELTAVLIVRIDMGSRYGVKVLLRLLTQKIYLRLRQRPANCK